ncbi:MAG: hypothetical protein NZ765_09865 [Anaerolineae bacterium]|nr:hypothetical protein [Anaerolineae bacterium]MDW8071907.1 hypothetical protein [Anaerolineae bacterium]
MKFPSIRTWPIWVWLLVMLIFGSSAACISGGLGDAENQRNNALRRAALAYELRTRGEADEVLVDFGHLEWRDNLGFAGRTVWLSPFAREEYLALRDPQRSYIYLHSPQQENGDFTIEVERGGPAGIRRHRLRLRIQDASWVVVRDEALP